jgi:hypothetical protein
MQLAPERHDRGADRILLVSPNPPDHFIVFAEPVRVLGRNLRFPDPAETVQRVRRLPDDRWSSRLELRAQREQLGLPTREVRVAERDL